MILRTALRCATVLALLPSASLSAQVIVDTGTPVGAINYTLSPLQSLAGYFTVGSATTITGFEGFISGSGGPATVTATLYGDGLVPDAMNALYSVSFTAPEGEDWAGATGLNWAVGAGNFWLGFASNDNLGMRDGAPSPLVAYAFTSRGGWQRYDDLDIGFRVFAGAIPEPGTWALLVLGFGAIGAGMRARRRPRISVSFAA